jgi:thiol-disulfide isomerase/thioredoxin
VPPSPDEVERAIGPTARHRVHLPLFFWFLVTLSLAAIGLGLYWLAADGRLGSGPAAGPAPIALTPSKAVDFQLSDLNGKQVRLSELRGKVVLLNFWATWCPPCKAEMPDLQALYRDYGTKNNFVVLAVDVSEAKEPVSDFVEQNRLSFPVLLDGDGRVSDFRYFVRSLPNSFIIDRNGNVRYSWIGQQSRQTMLSRLQSVW